MSVTTIGRPARSIPPAGERGDDCCSKHVVFNAGIASNARRTLAFAQPFTTPAPAQFNNVQNIPIEFTATRINNPNQKCTGGTMRISIFKLINNEKSFQTLVAESAGNAQEDNILDELGAGRYKFNLKMGGP